MRHENGKVKMWNAIWDSPTAAERAAAPVRQVSNCAVSQHRAVCLETVIKMLAANVDLKDIAAFSRLAMEAEPQAVQNKSNRALTDLETDFRLSWPGAPAEPQATTVSRANKHSNAFAGEWGEWPGGS